MFNEKRKQISAEFSQLVTLSPDTVLQVSDRIQGKAKDQPELVSLCKFGRSMQVRRLKNISSKNWNPSDWSNAQAIIDEVISLRKQAHSPAAVLALAVLGAEADTLNETLALLDHKQAIPVEMTEPTTRPERQSGKRK